MTKLAAKLQMLRRSDKGATMVEYGLIVVVVALVALFGATAMGTSLDGIFDTIAGKLKAPTG